MKCKNLKCGSEMVREDILDEKREDDRRGEVLTEYIIMKCPKCGRKWHVTGIYRVTYELIEAYYGEEIIPEKKKKKKEKKQ